MLNYCNFFQLTSNVAGFSSQTRDCFDDSKDFNDSRTFALDDREPEFGSGEVTHLSVSAQFELVVDPNLQQLDKLCALISEKNGLNLARNSESSGLHEYKVS